MNDVKFHYYRLPSVKGEGWAEIVLGSNGFFAAVSDYGNYAFRWTHFGNRDFRDFLLGCDWDYVRCKLNPEKVLDIERTEANLKHAVVKARHAKKLDRWDARDAWDTAHGVTNEIELNDWFHDYAQYIKEYWDLARYKPGPQIMAFVEKVLPRLKEAIRQGIAAEQEAEVH